MFRRAWKLLRSDFGRDVGWDIEYEDKIVGYLTDPLYEDMFWVSYRVSEADPLLSPILYNDDLWNECRFRYRSKMNGEYVDAAICGGSPPFVRDGRIFMRGLYLRSTSFFEDCCVRILGFIASRKKTA